MWKLLLWSLYEAEKVSIDLVWWPMKRQLSNIIIMLLRGKRMNAIMFVFVCVFLRAGEHRGSVGLCEESCFCHRIRNLILGCVRKLAHMVGF